MCVNTGSEWCFALQNLTREFQDFFLFRWSLSPQLFQLKVAQELACGVFREIPLEREGVLISTPKEQREHSSGGQPPHAEG